jgi:hypothetical protein
VTSFRTHQADIEQRRFLMTLPTFIAQYMSADKKRDRPPDARTPSTPSSDRNQDPKKAKIDPYVSKLKYDEWRLPRNKTFHEAFGGKSIADLPKGTKNGKQVTFCLKAFAEGKCPRGVNCNFLHDDPARHNAKEYMDKFFRKRYL